MEDNQLEHAIQADLETLKRLKMGIIPANVFYKTLFQGILIIFALFLGIQSIACYVAWHGGTKTYQNDSIDSPIARFQAVENQFQNVIQSMDESFQQFESKQPQKYHDALVAKNAARALQKKQREEVLKRNQINEHWVRVVKMVAGLLFSSLFCTLFFIGKVKNYVIFSQQLRDKLHSGEYITQKVMQALTLYFGLFCVFSLIVFQFFEQDMTFFAGILAFIISGVITTLFIGMEISRIGVSVLAQAVHAYFHKSPGMGTPMR